MQNKNTKGKIRLSFIAAIVCIGFFVYVTYRNMMLTESESRYIKSSVDYILKLDNVLADIQDIESGQRGFVITGEEKFLEPFYRGLDNLKADTAILAELSKDDSVTKPAHNELVTLLAQKVKYSKFAVELRRIFDYDSAASFIEKQKGLLLMNDIRSKIASLQSKDRELLRKSNIKREQLSQKRAWQLFSLAVIFYIILFINYRVIYRDFHLQQKSARLLKYNASLIGNISDAIVTTDKDYRITNWNVYAQQMYGYTESEVLGKEIGELFMIDYEQNGRS
jgi:CHASE3 domain sensor protein